MSSGARGQRLFIALQLPACCTRVFAQLSAQLSAQMDAGCGGRKVPAQNLHVTLAFLGEVEAVRVADVAAAMRAAVEATGSAGFDLTLDALQYRRNGGMLWARAGVTPPQLVSLVAHLRAALRARQFVVEDRAFLAHLTLLRDLRKPAALPDISPVRWSVNDITLMRSHLSSAGPEYEIILTVPLAVISAAAARGGDRSIIERG